MNKVQSKLLFIVMLSLLLTCSCPSSPAPYEKVLKNDDLVSFTTRIFKSFAELTFEEEDAKKILDLAKKWDDYVQAQEEMKGYCEKGGGFKAMFFHRYLYRDKQWKDKWKKVYDEYFEKPDPESQEYLDGLIKIIHKGLGGEPIEKTEEVKTGDKIESQTKTEKIESQTKEAK